MPAVPPGMIEKGFRDFAKLWLPILDEFQKLNVKFALEVHPTEIAFDIVTAERALNAIDRHPAFGFHLDASHLAYQGVDYIRFIDLFGDRIFHVHIKDVWWSDTPKEAGIWGGYTSFGDPRRFWEFRTPGRGKINFKGIINALDRVGYRGPLSVEFEDAGIDPEKGARDDCSYIRAIENSEKLF
jgi:sugar phosphate isomerase/epimerase